MLGSRCFPRLFLLSVSFRGKGLFPLKRGQHKFMASLRCSQGERTPPPPPNRPAGRAASNGVLETRSFWPHLGFHGLSFLLKPLDQLVHFQDLVLTVAEIVTVGPRCQPQLLILPGPGRSERHNAHPVAPHSPPSHCPESLQWFPSSGLSGFLCLLSPPFLFPFLALFWASPYFLPQP